MANVNETRDIVAINDGAEVFPPSIRTAMANANETRDVVSVNDGAEAFPSESQTIEVTPSAEIGSEVINTENGTVTVTTFSDEVIVRKENGEVRSTITRG